MIDKEKPRVAVFYDVLARTGMRNDGCPLFLNYNLRKILNGNTEMGTHDGNVTRLSPCRPFDKFGTFDLNILVDYGEDALGIPLDWEIPHPNAYWVSDAHLGYDYRLKRAKQFDHVFCAQKDFLKRFEADGVPRSSLHYLPHAFEPDVYRPLTMIKKWDWSFIGYANSEHRIDMLDRFIKEFPSYYLGWRRPGLAEYNVLDDVNEKFNMSRIVINDSVKLDVNMRTFEAMGSGACLLTQRIPETEDLFRGREHLVFYNDLDEMVGAAKWLLANENERKAIASRGHDEVMANHTYRHRAEEILKVCLNYSGKEVLEKCL